MPTPLRPRALAWQDRAACAGTSLDLWFPPSAEIPAEAKRLCDTCPVNVECLTYALNGTEFGVWAGTTPRANVAPGLASA